MMRRLTAFTLPKKSALAVLCCQQRLCGNNNSHGERAASTNKRLHRAEVAPVPLMVLDQVFRSDAAARSMHKALLAALACGNSEEAAEIAASLAALVKRRQSQTAASDANAPENRSSAANHDNGGAMQPLPPVTDTSIDHALDKVVEAVRSNPTSSSSRASGGGDLNSATLPDDATAPWLSPKHLTITILETSFEVNDDDGAPCAEEEHERLLDQYLTQESERWKAQKHAIAKIVLECARRCGVTPVSLHSAEGRDNQTRTGASLNVLKHSNVVVRGDVPEFLGNARSTIVDECRQELSDLVQRYRDRGLPEMSPHDKNIALTELVMSRTTVRYSVGLQKDFAASLDGLATQDGSHPSSDRYHREVIASLNSGSRMLFVNGEKDGSTAFDERSEEQDLRNVVAGPVLPFSFMIKMCLWFDAESIVEAGGA